MLRERFKARCMERAREDRESKVKGKRRGIDLSSDGPDELMDCEDDDDEAMMNDPVRWIVDHLHYTSTKAPHYSFSNV